MTSHVSGQSVIVTGAAGGIGAALAAELIDRGAAVVLADLSPSVADTAAALGSSAHAWTGDVSSVAGISELIAFADDRLGGVDAYFANAGIIGPGMLGDSDEDWDTIIDVNLRAHVRAAQALVPRWQEAGSGYFVATASAAGLLTPDRVGRLFGDQARLGRVRRMVGHDVPRGRNPRLGDLPDGREHEPPRCRRNRRGCSTEGSDLSGDCARSRRGGDHRRRRGRRRAVPRPTTPKCSRCTG